MRSFSAIFAERFFPIPKNIAFIKIAMVVLPYPFFSQMPLKPPLSESEKSFSLPKEEIKTSLGLRRNPSTKDT